MKKVSHSTKSISLILIAALATGACTKEVTKIEQVEVVKTQPGANTNEQPIKISADDTMTADALVEIGEQLVSPYTFMLADKSFDMALAKDPANFKAQLYKQFLRPMMAFKGIFKRIRPMLSKSGNLQSHDETIKNLPESPLKTFLLDGPEDISSVTGVQNVLVDIRNGFDGLRKIIKSNLNSELVLNLNPHIFQEKINTNLKRSCQVVDDTDKKLTVICDYSKIAQVKINVADLLAIGQVAGGYSLYLNFYTNYGLEGLENLGRWGKEKTSNQEIQNEIESNPGYGKLRQDHGWSSLRDLGSDSSAAVKYAIKYQKELCAAGRSSPTNRHGYLVEEGICVKSTDEIQRSLALLDQALNGIISVDAKLPNNAGHKEFKVNPFAWAANPLQDLRQVSPVSWTKCKTADSIRDNTLGGLFPQNDYNLLIEKCEM